MRSVPPGNKLAGLALVPKPAALEVQCWAWWAGALALSPTLLPRAGPASWKGCPKCPELGVTSATSWRPVTLDVLLVLVTPCPLGPEPDSTCPCAHGGEGAPECTERPGLRAPVRWGQTSAQLGLEKQPLAPHPLHVSCLCHYFPGDMTVTRASSGTAFSQERYLDPGLHGQSGAPGVGLPLCCPPTQPVMFPGGSRLPRAAEFEESPSFGSES